MDVSLLQRVLATAGARDRSDVAMILVHTRLAQLHFISHNTSRPDEGAFGQLPTGWNSDPAVYRLEYTSGEGIVVKLSAERNTDTDTDTLHLACEADGPESTRVAIDLNVSKLVTENKEAWGDAEAAYTMHSHTVVKKVDDMLAELGQRWLEAQQRKSGEADPRQQIGSAAAATAPDQVSRRDEPLRQPSLRQPRVFPGAEGQDPGYPAQNPFEIGRGDLTPGFYRPTGGEGMLVGPRHPMFMGRFPRPDWAGGVPRTGIPRGSVPPGARFDPIHGVPPGHPERPDNPYAYPRGPDFDELLPPGNWGPNF